jgi:drug/metabolite transporter (DMT)-like permease
MASASIDEPAEPSILQPRVLIPFILISLIWGSTWLVIRDQISVVPGSWSVAYRFGVASIGMFLLAMVMRQPLKLDARTMLWALLLGSTQFVLNFNFVYKAEHYITSGLVAVMFALLMIPNALLGKWWVGREISRSFIIGSGIATVGVALLMLQEYRAAPIGGDKVLIGVSLTLLAVLCASVSNVMQILPQPAKAPTTTFLAWAMLWGTLINSAWSLIQHGAPVMDPRPAYIGGVLYLAIIGSVITFPLYFRLIRDIGPGKAAYTSVLIPVIAMLLSTLFEDYRWTSLAIAGAVLVTIGMITALRPR